MNARTTRIALALGLLAGCGQPDPDGKAADPTPASVAAPNPVLAATPAQVAGGAGATTTPNEPFEGGEKAFAAVRDALLHGYGGAPVSEDTLYRAAVQGMLEHADPARSAWNKLLSPSEYQALHTDLEGQIVGIGAEIEFDETTGYSDIVRTLPSSPAEKAGLLAGDKILDVNGKLFKGKTEKDVLGEIRGKAGETVTLAVLRGDRVLPMPIVREVVAYEPVVDSMATDSIGYLQIKSFNAKTAPGVVRALGELSGHGAKALVVDLRCNPGGGFDDAVASADALLPAGAVFARIQKPGEAEKTFSAKGASVLATVPMVVLADSLTSSGGEVLAAALRDGRHASLVGSKTYGKWSLQTVSDLPNGYAIKYTISVIRTGDGKTYDGVGLPPDVEVDMDKKAMMAAEREHEMTERIAADSQLRTAIALLHSK